MSLTYFLAVSLLSAELPRLDLPVGSTWKQRVEMTTRFLPPDDFTESLTYEDKLEVRPENKLRHAMILVDSSLQGQKLAVPDKPEPLILEEPLKGWPKLTPEPESVFTRRLWRAIRYCPEAFVEVPAEREEKIPAATYRARVEKGEVVTEFRETGGLTAKGRWRFDKFGRVTSARIVCENAFAMGGDGTPATFTVTIHHVDAPAP